MIYSQVWQNLFWVIDVLNVNHRLKSTVGDVVCCGLNVVKMRNEDQIFDLVLREFAIFSFSLELYTVGM